MHSLSSRQQKFFRTPTRFPRTNTIVFNILARERASNGPIRLLWTTVEMWMARRRPCAHRRGICTGHAAPLQLPPRASPTGVGHAFSHPSHRDGTSNSDLGAIPGISGTCKRFHHGSRITHSEPGPYEVGYTTSEKSFCEKSVASDARARRTVSGTAFALSLADLRRNDDDAIDQGTTRKPMTERRALVVEV